MTKGGRGGGDKGGRGRHDTEEGEVMKCIRSQGDIEKSLSSFFGFIHLHQYHPSHPPLICGGDLILPPPPTLQATWRCQTSTNCLPRVFPKELEERDHCPSAHTAKRRRWREEWKWMSESRGKRSRRKTELMGSATARVGGIIDEAEERKCVGSWSRSE